MSQRDASDDGRIRVSGKGTQARVALVLSADEINTLDRIANYYNRNWGTFRHVVRMFSGPATRTRFRLVSEEGRWLQEFIRASCRPPRNSEPVTFTPLALFAFWGRLLSSLASPRARRKLNAAERERRSAMVDLFATAARLLDARDRGAVERALATRRASEQTWMREALGIDKENGADT